MPGMAIPWATWARDKSSAWAPGTRVPGRRLTARVGGASPVRAAFSAQAWTATRTATCCAVRANASRSRAAPAAAA